MAATLETISDALKQIDTKKENLKKAFDELQSQSQSSSFLSSFSLTWSDLDAHFTSMQSFLTHRFHVLQSQSKDLCFSPNPPTHMPKNPSSSANPQTQIPQDPSSSSNPAIQNPVKQVTNVVQTDSVPPRPELVAFCENMDGVGLRRYVNGASKDRNAIRAELPGAIRRAPDPASMVLDAMEGFYRDNEKNKGDKDMELGGVRRSCVLLLEVLMGISPNVGVEVGDRARRLAMEWKGKLSRDGENPLECLGFLHFVAAYGLRSEFSMDELIDYIVIIGKYRQTMDLCRKIGLGDKVAG